MACPPAVAVAVGLPPPPARVLGLTSVEVPDLRSAMTNPPAMAAAAPIAAAAAMTVFVPPARRTNPRPCRATASAECEAALCWRGTAADVAGRRGHRALGRERAQHRERDGGRERGHRRGQCPDAPPFPVRAVGGDGVPLQLGDELAGVPQPPPGVLGQAARQQRAQRLRRVLERDGGVEVLRHELGDGAAAVRLRTGEALEEDAARCVEVGGGGGRAALPLLRRHVGGRARAGALTGQDGDAEVDELAGAVRLDDDVRRLVVTVHHPDGMRRGQAQQRALEDGQRGLGSQPLAVLLVQDLAQ
ncbi:hypothetical protein LUX32_18090 [Actinomadura madurae]|nr:hypothetical protein [Actinomadura madurae]MCP9979295.1 hypothetical protein [Actinomadura madurae]